MKTPKYLQGKVKKIEKIDGYSNNNWFKKNDLKFKLVVDDIEKFKISFYGTQTEQYIINEDYKPLVLFAEDSKGVTHTLFDGRYYGFEALLIEDFTKINFKEKKNYIPSEEFEVYLWFNYSVDLDEEYPNDEIELINGEKRKKENMRNLLFDSFGLILKNDNGKMYSVIEMELT